LTIVHCIPTTGWTKWYLGSALLSSIVISIPGGVRHAWGKDSVIGICWVALTDPKERVVWVLASTHAWTILSAFVALVATMMVLVRLFVKRRATQNAFHDAGMQSHAMAKQTILRSVTLRILPHPLFLSTFHDPCLTFF
jgi:hypothetical protein